MVSLPGLLRRFRAHPVPGSPVLVPVPVDPRARAEAELGPVFDALDDAQRAAASIVAAAVTDAAQRRDLSVEATRARIAQAEQEATAARAGAARDVLSRADVECERAVVAARAEAERVARVGRERVPPLVEEVVRRALVLGAPDLGRPPATSRRGPERRAGEAAG